MPEKINVQAASVKAGGFGGTTGTGANGKSGIVCSP